MIAAVVFDLDGVIVDSEQVWDEVRKNYVIAHGGRWTDRAQRDMMGMSSVEWSAYVAEELGVDEPPEQISKDIASGVAEVYHEALPLLPGAREAVERLAERWPLAIASSSNREIIDLVLEAGDLGRFFKATVSSEEVGAGKPAPDVYLEAARRLGAEPGDCAAIEDSHNGIRSAKAAGMRVIAIPNPHFPPGEEALSEADAVLSSADELRLHLLEVLV
jgi:HAD superfamily hydrolase (TIGR01509 family)